MKDNTVVIKAKSRVETYVLGPKGKYTAVVRWAFDGKTWERKTKDFKQFAAASRWCSRLENEIVLSPEFK